MLKKLLFLVCLIISSMGSAQPPNFSWAITSEGTYAFVKDITTDVERNIYVLGNYMGTMDFDPGPDELNYYTNASTLKGVFVQKLDTNGRLIWAKAVSGSEYVVSCAMTTDLMGNSYIIGSFRGTADFDPGVGVYELTGNSNWNVFILKLDANGDFIWVTSFNYSGPSGIEASIATDDLGNIYTIGSGYYGLKKFDPDGNLLMSKNNNSNVINTSILVDDESNIYLAGYMYQTSVFETGDTLTSKGEEDAYIQKLDSSGNCIWAKSYGGISDDRCRSIVLDSERNVYATGWFYYNVDFDPGIDIENRASNGGADAYVIKLNNSGDFSWVKTFGSSWSDGCVSIAIDDSSNVYSIGFFTSNVTFDTQDEPTILSASNDYYEDVFAQKIDSSGNFIWAKSWGGEWSQFGRGITIDAIGNAYLTGDYGGCVDYNDGPGTSILCGSTDYFVLRLGWPANPWIPEPPPEEILEMMVFPNPVIDYLTILRPKPELLIITVTDVFGIIYQEIHSSELQIDIDMRPYATGIYIVQIKSRNDTQLKKIMRY